MKKCLLFFAMISLMAGAVNGCKKSKDPEPDNPNGLPNATQEGKNIFACRVNGENWIAEKGFRTIGGGVSDTSFGVHGTKDISNTSREVYSIGLLKTSSQINQLYSLKDTAKQFARYYGSEVNCFYLSGGYGTINIKAYEGELRLTKVDTVNGILSGTFRFNILTDYCDTMKVTDGRFDIRYY